MKSMPTLLRGFAPLLLAASLVGLELGAHDTGHDAPDRPPPVGPHGGDYGKLTRHFAEIVVRGDQLAVYILETDIKTVAADATRVGAKLQVPGGPPRELHLTPMKNGGGYEARISIPRRARRVFFHISCYLDGKPEKGKIMYEPRR